MGKYTQKPRAMQVYLQLPRRNRICGEAKYLRSREHFEGATGYVAEPNITVSWNRSMKDMEEKSQRDRDWESRNPPIGGAGG